MLCDTTELFGGKGPRLTGDLCRAPVSSHYHSYHYLADITDSTVGASGHRLRTRTEDPGLKGFWP